jgi:hypothetical protein
MGQQGLGRRNLEAYQQIHMVMILAAELDVNRAIPHGVMCQSCHLTYYHTLFQCLSYLHRPVQMQRGEKLRRDHMKEIGSDSKTCQGSVCAYMHARVPLAANRAGQGHATVACPWCR